MNDENFMRLALDYARAAALLDEVPVGAVAVLGGRFVAGAQNGRESRCDPLAHAELLALGETARTLGRWRLTGVTLYVTMEPCAMCAGALVNARVDRLVFGCRDPRFGAVRSLYRLVEDERLNHRLDVAEGVLAAESSQLLSAFFAQLRGRAACR